MRRHITRTPAAPLVEQRVRALLLLTGHTLVQGRFGRGQGYFYVYHGDTFLTTVDCMYEGSREAAFRKLAQRLGWTV